jgi:hypothetical protein
VKCCGLRGKKAYALLKIAILAKQLYIVSCARAAKRTGNDVVKVKIAVGATVSTAPSITCPYEKACIG